MAPPKPTCEPSHKLDLPFSTPNHTHTPPPWHHHPPPIPTKSDVKPTDVLRLVQEQSPHYKIAPWDIAVLRGLSTGAVAYVTLGNTKVGAGAVGGCVGLWVVFSGVGPVGRWGGSMGWVMWLGLLYVCMETDDRRTARRTAANAQQSRNPNTQTQK